MKGRYLNDNARLISGVEPAEQYLKTFHWNKVKYRADKPLSEIIDTLQKVHGPPTRVWNLLPVY